MEGTAHEAPGAAIGRIHPDVACIHAVIIILAGSNSDDVSARIDRDGFTGAICSGAAIQVAAYFVPGGSPAVPLIDPGGAPSDATAGIEIRTDHHGGAITTEGNRRARGIRA